MIVDCYKPGNGGIKCGHSSEQPVTLKFGLPAALQNKSVSIVAYNNKTGEYTEFKDTGSTIEEVVSRMQNEG